MLSRLQAENPEPTPELQDSSVFELLTAMLSAQATDVSVNKATGPNSPEPIRQRPSAA